MRGRMARRARFRCGSGSSASACGRLGGSCVVELKRFELRVLSDDPRMGEVVQGSGRAGGVESVDADVEGRVIVIRGVYLRVIADDDGDALVVDDQGLGALLGNRCFQGRTADRKISRSARWALEDDDGSIDDGPGADVGEIEAARTLEVNIERVP